MTASTEPPVPSVSSFPLPNTSTRVILVTSEACARRGLRGWSPNRPRSASRPPAATWNSMATAEIVPITSPTQELDFLQGRSRDVNSVFQLVQQHSATSERYYNNAAVIGPRNPCGLHE